MSKKLRYWAVYILKHAPQPVTFIVVPRFKARELIKGLSTWA